MSSVSETSDKNLESEEFNASIYEQSNVQVFFLNITKQNFIFKKNILIVFHSQ
jgi:hypothetical protein